MFAFLPYFSRLLLRLFLLGSCAALGRPHLPAGLGFVGAAAAAPPTPPAPLRALLVAGGPDADSNAAQIEGHARFVARLLPAASRRRVLFADGHSGHRSVSYADPGDAAQAAYALSVLLPKSVSTPPNLHRRPDLGGVRLDGASRREDIHAALAALRPRADEAAAASPLLLYFAGHGSQGDDDQKTSRYDLWSPGGELGVRDLAAELARLPAGGAPVVLVMVQCYSGGFADALFRGGDPQGEPVAQNVAGFFATTREREASGCGWETGEEDYQDFSSYFFGALGGQDRFGHPVAGADSDGDGRVTLHEAFCYALVHDPSADVPTCTSDAFLRRFAPLPDAEIFGVPFAEIQQAATPAQRAALDALSARLGLAGEGRALAAYDRLHFADPVARPAVLARDREAADRLNALRQQTLADLLTRWPALRWRPEDTGSAAHRGATAELLKNADLRHALAQAEKASERAEEAVSAEEAGLLRFTGLCESVVRARHLRAHGPEPARARFRQLWEAETSTLPLAAPAR